MNFEYAFTTIAFMVLFFAALWFYGLYRKEQMENCLHEYEYYRKCVSCGKKERRVQDGN